MLDRRFSDLIERLDPAFRQLLASMPFKPLEAPRDIPGAGVYLFSEGGLPLYVGRSNRLRTRLGHHCREKASHGGAAFAFRLAREETGQVKATYRVKGSRTSLMHDPKFAEAFAAAKARIRKMDVRVVEEADPIRQGLLEVYVAVALETKYNDFDTH